MDNLEDKKKNLAHLKVIFIRTMRRLGILCRFARNVGITFDIDNMDIATLTKRKYLTNSSESNLNF